VTRPVVPPPVIPPFDSSAAWANVTRLVAANADVLIAIAGVFFLLPMLAWSVFVAPPPVTAQMDEQQLAQVLQDYYTRNLPYLLPISLMQITGFITMLVGILDRRRPTVGEALRNCAARVPAYFVSQILVGLFAFTLMMAVAAVLAALHVPMIVAAVAGMVAMLYPMLRTIMVGPVLGVGRTHNPLMAIRASIALTRGNVGRILAFLGLAGVLFAIVYGLAMMIVGLAAQMLLGAQSDIARLVSDAISALLYSAGYTYFVVMLAAIHGQLTRDLPRPFT